MAADEAFVRVGIRLIRLLPIKEDSDSEKVPEPRTRLSQPRTNRIGYCLFYRLFLSVYIHLTVGLLVRDRLKRLQNYKKHLMWATIFLK